MINNFRRLLCLSPLLFGWIQIYIRFLSSFFLPFLGLAKSITCIYSNSSFMVKWEINIYGYGATRNAILINTIIVLLYYPTILQHSIYIVSRSTTWLPKCPLDQLLANPPSSSNPCKRYSSVWPEVQQQAKPPSAKTSIGRWLSIATSK